MRRRRSSRGGAARFALSISRDTAGARRGALPVRFENEASIIIPAIAGHERSLARTARLTREPAWCLAATLAILDNWKYLEIYGANLDRIADFRREVNPF